MKAIKPITQKQLNELMKKNKKLRDAAKPILKLLANDYHPHMTVIITSTSIELMEGVCSFPEIYDYIKD